MGNKKDIGKIFQEQFKDFEQAPESGIWDTIASELDRKNDRKIAPLWYYFGGSIMVILIVSMLVWQPWKSQQTNLNEDSNITSLPNFEHDTNNERIQNDNLEYTKVQTEESVKETNNILSENKSNLARTKENTTYANIINNSIKQVESSVSKATTSNNELKNNDNLNSQNSSRYATLASIREAIAQKRIERNQKEKEAKLKYQERIKKELALAIEEQKQENLRVLRSTAIANNAKTKKETHDKNATSNLDKTEKKPITSTSTKKENKLPKSDLERAIDREEAIKYEIAISPYTSLLRYGSLAKGSSIDDRLVDNPRDAIATTGYGIRVDYTLSEKSSLRVGIGVAPLKYRTDNFQVSINNNNVVNIYQLSGITFQDLNQGGIVTSPEALTFFNQNQVVSIEQDISYIEVPVDYQYRFINKRVSLSINPGISLFVLTNNSVYATANNGQSLLIGRETDLNDLSLAFNLGLGAHYNLSKHWRLNAEPTFKYQLNPYTNSVGNFRPYYIGMQFGISYKFK